MTTPRPSKARPNMSAETIPVRNETCESNHRRTYILFPCLKVKSKHALRILHNVSSLQLSDQDYLTRKDSLNQTNALHRQIKKDHPYQLFQPNPPMTYKIKCSNAFPLIDFSRPGGMHEAFE